jgi:hypothetical protein
MESLLLLLAILAGWYILNRWILPLLGVKT